MLPLDQSLTVDTLCKVLSLTTLIRRNPTNFLCFRLVVQLPCARRRPSPATTNILFVFRYAMEAVFQILPCYCFRTSFDILSLIWEIGYLVLA